MEEKVLPSEVKNWIGGEECASCSEGWFDKLNPANGQPLCRVARSTSEDVELAVQASLQSQPAWGDMPGVKRGEILYEIAYAMKAHRKEVAQIVHLETGKSFGEALGETDGAIALALFMAGEGQRLYGRTTTSGVPNKYATTIRQPVGVAGLIIAANTPIANAAWKVFPALICGNSTILKAAEDTPATAWILARIAHEAGIPPGVFNVIQGFGEEAGAPLVLNPRVDVISFTGSTEVGREIAVIAGQRLAKVSLELGGKNPLLVCDDADLENAAKWILLSAFSNAGQRCASASRIIVFESVYQRLKEMLVERTRQLKIGPTDEDDFGPVINEQQLKNMLDVVERARQNGASIIIGGNRLTDPEHQAGFYMAPTLIEGAGPHDEISTTEIFGPIACLYKVSSFSEGLDLANDSPYGLTACIHTRSLHRAIEFAQKVKTGVSVVNAGTYGSEPHMPFGGVKQSGNGTREPGTEALDVYSELKDVYINIDPQEL